MNLFNLGTNKHPPSRGPGSGALSDEDKFYNMWTNQFRITVEWFFAIMVNRFGYFQVAHAMRETPALYWKAATLLLNYETIEKRGNQITLYWDCQELLPRTVEEYFNDGMFTP